MPDNYSLYIDLGNTAAHIGIWTMDWLRQRRVSSSDMPEADDWAALLKDEIAAAGLQSHDCRSALACASTERIRPAAAAVQSALGAHLRLLGRELDVPLTVDYEDPATFGRDRLIAVFAADQIVGRPCIVLDAGTYITCDLLAPDGTVIPVAIAPGLPVLRVGGRATVSHLPELTADIALDRLRTTQPPARSTEQCVAFGAASALGGAADRLIAAARTITEGRPDAPIVITGGDASLIADLIDSPVRLEPMLCLDGLRMLDEQSQP